MAGSRVDQWLVTVNVAGQDLGTFDTFTGGKLTGSASKHRDGGMGKERPHGGPRTREDITVTRRYDFDRDHPRMGFLDNQVGKGRVAISRQPLDGDGIPYGKPRVYTGGLLSVDSPEHNSNESGIGMLTLEVEADEDAA